jgi:hypothetical protein
LFRNTNLDQSLANFFQMFLDARHE